ncbi:MAG: hypothetical protein J2P17_08190 [Mycobacterium sp.]|nr:hypothetical protein [Mycobacterium sp.]
MTLKSYLADGRVWAITLSSDAEISRVLGGKDDGSLGRLVKAALAAPRPQATTVA